MVYFNLGSHHVPHSGDIPNTLMHTSASSIMFTPFNFNDRDPSRKSVQGVKIIKNGNSAQPKYFGGTYKDGLKIEKVSFLLWCSACETGRLIKIVTIGGIGAGSWALWYC